MREDLHGDVKPRAFAPLPVAKIIYRVETIDKALPDLPQILKDQWLETGDPELDFAPNWNFYRLLEQSGNGALIVAREHERAIGFLWIIVHPSVNATATVTGTISTWFMEQRHSRALLERSLLRAGIDWARKKGAKRVVVETSYEHSAARLLVAMGFVPDKIGYKMPLEA